MTGVIYSTQNEIWPAYHEKLMIYTVVSRSARMSCEKSFISMWFRNYIVHLTVSMVD